MIGTLLQNRYRLDSELGQGGMGRVFRGYDILLERQVAIKILNAASQARLGSQGRARLLHEAQAAARLNHPNIVAIYDAGEAILPGLAEATPFIVMELLKGHSLFEHRPEAFAEVIAIGRQICAALEQAHTHGIIHRDLKPENIIVEPDGTVKLTDFGLARSAASRLAADGAGSGPAAIVGTVFYLAPESALRQPVDARADLYSLGVILYELVTGHLPFEAGDLLAVISQHLYAQATPPTAYRPEVPPPLEDLILRLMSKQPEKRPSSAGEVRRLLEAMETSAYQESATPAPDDSPLPALSPRQVKLVGRERELAALYALWQRAAEGEGHTLIVSGESGIGKTRLVRELLAQAALSGSQVLMGVCYPEGGVPYAPFNQILAESYRTERPGSVSRHPEDSRQGTSQRAGEGLNLPDYILADLITISPELRLHLPEISPNPPLYLQSEQQHVFESVAAWTAALASRAPVLLFIDDVHWADSSTLFLIRTLARRAPRLRLLIVLTYREVELDEAGPLQNVLVDLNRERLSTRLKLTRFDREQTRLMLEALLNPRGEIAPVLLDAIYQETEGNPFFIEEVTKALIEEGKLCYVDLCWAAQQPEELEIPQSVRVAIQSRLARLPSQTQETLRLAAVIGRQFDFDILQKASDLNEETLIDALEIAERAQIIHAVPQGRSPTTVFSFAHALFPSTLREGIGGLRRQRLHRRVAQALEAMRAEISCCYETLAYHYEQAGDAENALKHYTLAGDQALGVYANQEAGRHYRLALELALSEAERARLLSELGEALFRQSLYAQSEKAWQEAIDLYQALGDHNQVARLYARLARAAWYNSDTPRSLDLCRQGLEVVRGLAATRHASLETHGMAALLHETARACHFNDLQEEALALCRQALPLARRLNLLDIQAETLSTLGLLPNLPYEERQNALIQAVELAESGGLLATAARAHINLGEFFQKAGDLPAARRHYLQARELARRAGIASWEHGFIGLAADLSLEMGDFAEVERALQAMRDLHREIPNPGPAAYYTRLLEAHLARLRGEWEKAVALYQQCQVEAAQRGEDKQAAFAGQSLGETFSDMGRDEEAAQIFSDLICRNEERGLFLQSATPLFLLGAVYLRQGRLPEGRQALLKAHQYAGNSLSPRHQGLLEWSEARLAAAEKRWEAAFAAFGTLVNTTIRLSAPWYQARGLVEWAGAHLARGNPEDLRRAKDLLQDAHSIYRRLEVPLYAAAVERRLASLQAGLAQ